MEILVLKGTVHGSNLSTKNLWIKYMVIKPLVIRLEIFRPKIPPAVQFDMGVSLNDENDYL